MSLPTDSARTAVEDILLVSLPSTGLPHTMLGLVATVQNGYSMSAALVAKAKRHLQEQAHALGADAVVDVRVDVAITSPGPVIAVAMAGTAILLPWPHGHDEPSRHLGADRPLLPPTADTP